MAISEPARDAEVSEVWRLLAEKITALEPAAVPLAQAVGRGLRADILADADQPPFDRAAMDGYAFFPVNGPASYRVLGAIKAGETLQQTPKAGEAWRIFTGAALPAAGMAVLMQEEARVEDGTLHVTRPVAPGENVRARGSDARKGERLLSSGLKLGPAELSVLASIGLTHPLVTRAPRVAHATTGDEIVPPEAVPAPGQIRNSNQILLAALLAAAGVPRENLYQEHWGDDPARAAARLVGEPFASADLVIISGGASVGEHDYTARVLEGAGYGLPIRKVNSRPGRPLIVGWRGRQIAFGLPGNPVSHFVCHHLFVRPALARLAGLPPPLWRRMPLGAPLLRAGNRRPTFWPATLNFNDQGQASVQPLPWNNSGHLAALAGVQALFTVPADTVELPAGALVDTLPVADIFQS